SPEGCAAILWKQANEQTNSASARALRLTAVDNLELGIIDEIVPEPVGGAHRDRVKAADILREWIAGQLQELRAVPIEDLVRQRYERFRRLGSYTERPPEVAEAAIDPQPRSDS